MSDNLSPSLVRTLVPFLVGPLVTLLGVQPDDPVVGVIVSGVVGYLYYAVVRFLEVFASPKWGYILGIAKSPGYKAGDPVKGAPVGKPHEDGFYEIAYLGRVLVVIGLVIMLADLLLTAVSGLILVGFVLVVVGALLAVLGFRR